MLILYSNHEQSIIFYNLVNGTDCIRLHQTCDMWRRQWQESL